MSLDPCLHKVIPFVFIALDVVGIGRICFFLIITVQHACVKILLKCEKLVLNAESHVHELTFVQCTQRRLARIFAVFWVRVVWDVATLILVIYIALITPVRIGFELDTIPGTGMFIWEQFIDVFFLLDILLNFRTGFVRKDGALEMQPRKIAWNYLKTYFLIDLVSSFPIDAFVQSMENLQSAKVLKAGKILKVGRILKLAKLARLLKLPHLLGRFEEDITLSVVHVKLMRILLTTSLIAHLDACGWAFMSRLGDTYYSDSWVQAYGALDDSVASQYVSAMYWAITTMTTVGYGDIAPETDAERLYCLVTMIFGGGFYAYVIATLSSIVTNQDANQRMVTERMENIQTYMRIRKFPKQLARRVRKYYKHYYEMKTALNESTILEDLSPALRSEVVIFLVDQTVMQNPLFQQMSPKSFARLIRILFPLKVEEGEWVCREGEFGEEMFMLVSGKLEVVDAKGSVVAVLSSGAHFGELCALGVTNTRTCGVRALECCEMYALSKTDFFETFADSEPKTIKNMIRIAVAAYEDFDFQKTSMQSTRAAKGETSSAMYQKGAGPVPQAERGGDVAGTLKSGPSLVSIGSIPSAAAAAMGAAAGGLNSSFSSSPREGYGGKHQYSDPVLTRLAVLEANTAEQLGTLVEAVGRLENPQFASRIKVTASDLEEEDSPTFERITYAYYNYIYIYYRIQAPVLVSDPGHLALSASALAGSVAAVGANSLCPQCRDSGSGRSGEKARKRP
ncbi:Potassium voltage-gated channel protein eag [Hondaea fermentalgiana]|uniref:Potassium voltage-gated channel protein eag n=1 Tax=Hondaea fermentalgiana TaxID=2315210 RepID=A0A2R5GDX7_9STRA|nr:Potassium voltage-gated channel protein eag [Hondaea fermentalgiana]|eukprot:GBG29142.1 Potassium voltage-gated channel protein eag [Hondaea fermentalgiana]